MKFTSILAPLATLTMVIAHGDGAYKTDAKSDAKPVSFTKGGINNLVNVATQSSQGDGSKLVSDAMDFFKRNPAVLRSILTEAKQPEHASAVEKVKGAFGSLVKVSGGIDLYETGIQTVNYIDSNPDFLKLIQKVSNRVTTDSPTLVDDFFAQAEKVAAENPTLVPMVKDYLIKFSHDNEDVYKKAFKLILESSMINSDFSSHILVHLLQVDKAGSKNIEACASGNGGSYPGEPSEPNAEYTKPETDGANNYKGETTPSEPETDGADIYKGETTPSEPATGKGSSNYEGSVDPAAPCDHEEPAKPEVVDPPTPVEEYKPETAKY